MDDEDRNRVQHLVDWLTPQQCAYLVSVVNYRYSYAPELAKQLNDLELILSHGRLLIPTEFGREVAKICGAKPRAS